MRNVKEYVYVCVSIVCVSIVSETGSWPVITIWTGKAGGGVERRNSIKTIIKNTA